MSCARDRLLAPTHGARRPRLQFARPPLYSPAAAASPRLSPNPPPSPPPPPRVSPPPKKHPKTKTNTKTKLITAITAVEAQRRTSENDGPFFPKSAFGQTNQEPIVNDYSIVVGTGEGSDDPEAPTTTLTATSDADVSFFFLFRLFVRFVASTMLPQVVVEGERERASRIRLLLVRWFGGAAGSKQAGEGEGAVWVLFRRPPERERKKKLAPPLPALSKQLNKTLTLLPPLPKKTPPP